MRQAVLGEVTAQNAARALRIGEEFGTRNEAVVDLLEKAQAEKKSNYEGYTVDQLIFMKTHYATLRPSETLLRKQEDERKPLRKLKKILGRGKGQNGEQQQPKFLRSHTDDLSLPVMSPTHEDEVELARRREEFRIRSRQLKHKVLKSHTH